LSDLWLQVATPGTASSLLTTAVELEPDREPLRLGRDREGLLHLLVPLAPGLRADRVPGGQGLSVTTRDLLVDDRPVRYLDLSCLRVDLAHVFAGLAVDICMRLLVGSGPVGAVAGAIEEWRALVGRGSEEWTRSRCAGLLGELTVLRRLLKLDPATLATWAGPLGAAQDFRAYGQAIEVKSTLSPEGRTVRVHGSDQLEEPESGELHLVWFRVGEPNDGTGVTVRSVITELAHLVQDVILWSRCLSKLRVPPTEHPEFDTRRFAVLDERWYRVDGAFPRVVPASFAIGAVPGGVGGIEYLVDLDAVPVAQLIDRPAEVLARMAGRQ
jgi:hypothetical protein